MICSFTFTAGEWSPFSHELQELPAVRGWSKSPIGGDRFAHMRHIVAASWTMTTHSLVKNGLLSTRSRWSKKLF